MTEESGTDEQKTEQSVGLDETENRVELPPREEGEAAIHYLDRLRDMNRYVFHGSPDSELSVLEPKPATATPGSWQADTAVFGSSSIAMSVERAIQGKKSEREGRYFTSLGYDRTDHRPMMMISQNVKLGPGVVYVCPRGGFEESPTSSIEYKSQQAVTPLGKVTVTPEDYTKDMGGKIVYVDTEGRELKNE